MNYEMIDDIINEITGKETIDIVVKYGGDISYIEKEQNITIEYLGSNYAIITIFPDKIPVLYGYKEIEYIEFPKNLTYSLNRSRNKTCVNQLKGNGFNLTGKGVLVGIIDSGIDYTHYDFRNEDGTTRIMYLWDQYGTENPPSNFKSGTEYNSEDINKALSLSNPYDLIKEMDTIGHGTAVAGIACGNGKSSNKLYTGIAPEASIAVVRLKKNERDDSFSTIEIMKAFKYLVDKAEIADMPIVINLSFGTNNGGHDGKSLFETYINSISQRWKTAIVVATGNEGYAGHHISGVLKTGEMKDINFVVPVNINHLNITLWKKFIDDFSFELIAPNGMTSDKITNTSPSSIFNVGGIKIFSHVNQPNHYNVDQEVYFNFIGKEEYIPIGIWTIRIISEKTVEGKFNIWLPTIEEVTQKVSFSNPTSETTLTIPSTALNVISVGGYNSYNDSSANFSGQGFTRNRVYEKPDLVAPAVDIITTQRRGGYHSFSGTSASAPFVTGSIALMMEWGIVGKNDLFLYGQKVKAFLRKGASRKEDKTYPNPIWGYGTLCLLNTMNYLIEIKEKEDFYE